MLEIEKQINNKLLEYINRPLEYRSVLDLPDFVTFGIEIEFEDANSYIVEKNLKSYFSTWLFERDKTVLDLDMNDIEVGGEVISPILKDNVRTWKEIYNVCNFLKRSGASIIDFAGGHIHIGTQVLGYNKKEWLNFIKLWIVYEHLIYRFSFGERLGARFCINEFARQLNKYLLENLACFEKTDDLEEILSYFPSDKYTSINIKHVNITNQVQGNTIEIRCPNGTLNPLVWQNNINFFTKFILYCTCSNYDVDFINYKLNSFRDTNYNQIYLYEAIELCNLVFSNDLDKLYFLKQYLKGFNIINNEMDNQKIYHLN